MLPLFQLTKAVPGAASIFKVVTLPQFCVRCDTTDIESSVSRRCDIHHGIVPSDTRTQPRMVRNSYHTHSIIRDINAKSKRIHGS